MRIAKDYFNQQKFDEALDIYFKVQKFHQITLGDRIRMAVCYYEVGKLDESLNYLRAIVQASKKLNPIVALCMARCFHEKNDFQEAIVWYKKYLSLTNSKDKKRESIKDEIKRCATGLNIANLPEENYVQNLGESINSKGDEFAPLLSPASDEKLYFSSARETSFGGLRNETGLRDEQNGTYSSDIFSAELDNGEWGDIKALTYLLNGPRYDVALDFSKNGKLMYYFQGYNLYSGEILVDTFKTFESRTTGKHRLIGPIDALHGDNYLFFFHDTLLFFSSRRGGGFGGSDIYYSQLINNQWQNAINLGREVNSEYDEICPFLSEDGRTLYFSSNSTQSMGGFDILKSVFVDDSLHWTLPENVGLPINSTGDDAFFRPNSAGSLAYFSSNRKECYGQRDIYSVNFRNSLACQSTRSEPDLFFKIAAYQEQLLGNQNASSFNTKLNTIFTYSLQPLIFDKDSDLYGARNQKTISTIITILKKHPNIRLRLVSHSDDNSGGAIDAFNSIKRLEKIVELFAKEEIELGRIELLGCGSNYPIALNAQEGTPSEIGKKLNRRVDPYFLNETKNIKIDLSTFDVPEYLQSGEHFRFKNLDKGLCYRVEIATIKQMYNGDLVNKYPDLMIEKNAGESTYHYSLGLFSNFDKAESLCNELKIKGVENAKIVPFVAGWKSEGIAAKKHIVQYPDLQKYINKLK
ncbi:MAG: hypothetical protein ACOYOA_03535 [Saprospiraceae bacterium]